MTFDKLFADYRHQMNSCLLAIQKDPSADRIVDSFILSLEHARDCIIADRDMVQQRGLLLQTIDAALNAWLQYKTCRDNYFDEHGCLLPQLLEDQHFSSREAILLQFAKEKEQHWKALWELLGSYWFQLLED